MKKRYGYVSNSSSSSFVIRNWGALNDAQRNRIINYSKEAFEEWLRLGIVVEELRWNNAYHISNCISRKLPDYLNFGYIIPSSDVREWTVTENPDGTATVETSMDNFNMYRWMDYLGGYDYHIISDDNGNEGFVNHRIYVCSQYRGDVEENVRRAKSYCREIALSGNVPICPHIYFTQFLDDNDEDERGRGIELGKQLLISCDIMNVYKVNGVVSEGMQEEIEFAKRRGYILIRYFEK